MSIELPSTIHRYFETETTNDTDSLSDLFSVEAVVIDEQKTYQGRDAIKAWKLEAKATTSYQVTPLEAAKAGEQYVVTGRVEGNFPGSPVRLRYFFTLRDDQIAALEIKP